MTGLVVVGPAVPGVATIDNNWSGGEVAGAFAGGAAVLTAIGAGFRWVIGWFSGQNDKRIAALEREIKEARSEVHECRHEIRALNNSVLFLGREIVLLLDDVPNPDARKRASDALSRVFPVEYDTPPDMLAKITALFGTKP